MVCHVANSMFYKITCVYDGILDYLRRYRLHKHYGETSLELDIAKVKSNLRKAFLVNAGFCTMLVFHDKVVPELLEYPVDLF